MEKKVLGVNVLALIFLCLLAFFLVLALFELVTTQPGTPSSHPVNQINEVLTTPHHTTPHHTTPHHTTPHHTTPHHTTPHHTTPHHTTPT
jgi:hypothetical protein